MMLDLCIDHRERALIDVLHTRWPQLSFRVENLTMGDMMLTTSSPPSQSLWVIERKTHQDLEQSVKDGRYREQKARLLAHYPACQIMYILEGQQGIKFDDTHMSYNKLIAGCVMNTILRDHIHVVQTSNLQETAAFLVDMCQRVSGFSQQTPNQSQEGSSGNSYVNTIKARKKDNMSPEMCMLLQIATIPGLSVTKAKTIVDHFGIKRLAELAHVVSRGPDGVKRLMEVDGIGKKLAIVIQTYLHDDTP